MRLTLHFDGSCWPNPGGLAKYGYTLRGSNINVSDSGFAGEGPSTSNNYAEFYAMALGLGAAFLQGGDHVTVIGDSEIAIKIMQGRYKASRDKLYWPAYSQCMIMLQRLYERNVDVEFKWVPREQNQEADDLSKLPATKPVDPALLAEAEEFLLK